MTKAILFQQNHNGGKKNKGLEAIDEFVITCSDPAKMLQSVEKAFDQMPLFVLPPIAFPWIGIVFLRRYCISPFAASDIVSDFLCTISFISHYYTAADIDLLHERYRSFAIMNITASKQ